MEVFMDDFSIYETSFDDCLHNLNIVLQRCEETHLVLNWEKCHLMVNEDIVLGHRISERSIEVDRAKAEAIEKMPYPADIKVYEIFLVMLVSIKGLLKTFLKFLDLLLIFCKNMFIFFSMMIVRKLLKFLRKL